MNVSTTITINSNGWQSAFGTQCIDKDVFSWYFKILKWSYDGSSRTPPYIGILEDTEENWNNAVGYELCCKTMSLNGPSQGELKHYSEKKDICSFSKPGQILEMRLDLNAKTLKFSIDNKINIASFSNIKDTKYTMNVRFVFGFGSQLLLL